MNFNFSSKNLTLCFVFLISFHASGKVILIDPGHGGTDLGAWKRESKESIIYEKNLALDLAKRIQKLLKKKHTVYLSRSFDIEVELAERAEKAEKVKADLVISVHINSSSNSKNHGVETYYLGNNKDTAVKKIERIENEKMGAPPSIIQQILADLIVSKTVPKSRSLASTVHKNIMKRMKKKYKLKDRGIKSAIFYILALSKRPGVLLEVGFMSNKRELNLMKTNKFKNDYAKAVAEGINRYIKKSTKEDISLF